MANKKKARGKKPNRSPWYYFIFVGVVLVIFVFLRGNYGFVHYLQLTKQKKQLVHEIEQLRQQREQLNTEIHQLMEDYQYIEKFVREKYKMGKPGEKIFFMISPGAEENKDVLKDRKDEFPPISE
ncbi:MAG: septum formation initiator family protein [bacterium]|nr:septum formation initiator family protein [bacterium]